jgi:hypothetical protein
MDMLQALFSGPTLRAGTPGPFDKFWYEDVGTGSVTGLSVDADSAQKASGYFRGSRFCRTTSRSSRSTSMNGSTDGAKQRAANPLYDVLHTQPNAWQTSFEWRRQGVRP